MKQEQIGIIQAINGKYVAIDKNGKVRILQKGDIVYEGEELRYEGEVIKNIFDSQATLEEGGVSSEILDTNDPYLVLQHLKTGDTYLLSHAGYLYLSTDVSSGDNISSITTKTTKNTFANNENQAAGGRSQAGEFFGILAENIIKDGSFMLGYELTPLQEANEKLDATQEESIDRVQKQETSQKSTEEIIKENNKDKDSKVAIKPNVPPTIEGGDFAGKVKELPDNHPSENVAKLQADGKIQFNDPDTTDSHTATSTPKETSYKGNFTAKVENGEIVWNFSVDDKDLDTLKEGEILTQIYTVTLDDGNGGTITKDVTITLEGTNDAPIAQPDIATTNEDTPIAGNVLDNDSDVDGDALSVKSAKVDTNGNGDKENITIGSPIAMTNANGDAIGIFKLNLDGSYTFTPAQNYTDSIPVIDYTVTDGEFDASSTLTLGIESVNDAPVANPDENNIDEDTEASGNVLANDRDAENDILHVKSATVDINGDGNEQPLPIGTKTTLSKNGKPIGDITLNADGTYIFTPAPDYSDEVPQITYVVSDGNSDATSTLNITINPINDEVTIATLPKHTVNEANLSNGSSPDTQALSKTGAFSFASVDGLGKLSINGNDFTLANLQAFNGTQSIATDFGTLALNSFTGDKQGGTISYTYTLTKTVDNDTEANATPNEYVEKITIQVNDIDTDSATSTLDIKILDDTPTAKPDTNSIQEDASPNTVSANVLTNDTQGADGAKVSGVKNGDDTSADATSNVATDVIGDYGKVNINADGSYTYTLDNSNTNVQALGENDTLEETFTYTIKDNDGDTSTSTLTITIKGENDGVTITGLNADTTPEHTVNEANLSNGSNPNPTALSKADTFSFTCKDGLDKVTIHGTDFTLTQLNALSTTNHTITTDYGTLKLTNYTGTNQGGTISYTYTLTTTVDNDTKADATDTHYIEKIAIQVKDIDGDTSSDSLDIKIIDDTPTAKENTTSLSIEEGGEIYTSTEDTNLLKNDTLGADGATVTSITYKDENGDLVTDDVTQDNQFTTFNTQHGILHVKKDGSWKFTSDSSVDNTNLATEAFTYTITDGDGDTSSADQSIEITDTNPTANPTSGSVDEEGLSNGSNTNSTKTTTTQDLNIAKNHDDISDVVFADNISTYLPSLTSNGVAINYAFADATKHKIIAYTGSDKNTNQVFTVEFVNPTDTTGDTQKYSFTLLKPIDHTAPTSGQDENIQELTFKFDLKDTDSTVANQTFKVDIVDDVPTAVAGREIAVDEKSGDSGKYVSTTDTTDGISNNNLLTNDINGADGVSKVHSFTYTNSSTTSQTVTFSSSLTTKTVNTKYGELTVSSDGTWSYKSTKTADHDPNNDGIQDPIRDNFTYTIKDKDGDISSATQVINILDTAPSISAKTSVVDEHNLFDITGTRTTEGANEYNKDGDNNALNDDVPDTAENVKISLGITSNDDISDVVFTTTTPPSGLKSENKVVSYSLSADKHTLTAKDNANNTVFVATLHDTNSKNAYYTFTLHQALDHPAVDGRNIMDLGFDIKVIDSDGSEKDGNFTVKVVDSIPNVGNFSLETNEDESLTINLSESLQNVTINGSNIAVNGTTKIQENGVDVGTLKNVGNGSLLFTPNTHYSGKPSFAYSITDSDGDTAEGTVKITVKPVSDAPGITVVSQETYEDTAVALGLTVPTITDTTDQNGATPGDNPERIGAITISDIPVGAKILKGNDTVLFEATASDSDVTIKLSDIGVNYHISGLSTDKILTKVEFEALKILPPLNSHVNINLKISAIEHEVDENGNVLAGVAGATTEKILHVNVKAVTDEIKSLKFSDDTTTKTFTIDEDDTLDLTDELVEGFGDDTDGSEKYWYEISGLEKNTKVVIGTTTYTATTPDGNGKFKIENSNNKGDINSTTNPNLKITPPEHFSGKIENIKLKLKTQDTDNDSSVTPAIDSKVVTLSVHVKPIVDDISDIEDATTKEDTSNTTFLNGFSLVDSDGSESVTKLVFSGLEEGTKITLGGVEKTATSAGTLTFGDGTSDMLIATIQAATITPPKNSSKDMNITLTASLKDTATDFTDVTAEKSKTFKLTVTPVAEVVSGSDTGDASSDVTINPSHDYDATHATEDEPFSIGIELNKNWKNSDDTVDFGKPSHNHSSVTNGTDSEQTFAHLTFGTGSGTSFTIKAGAIFTYSDGTTTHTLTDTGSGVDIPAAYRSTVTVQAPLNESGNFTVKVQAKTVDYGEDSTDTKVEAISGQSFLTFTVDGVADIPTVAVKPAKGDEDAGRVDGNDTTSTPADLDHTKGIPLSITPSSSDTSETFNIKIDEIPNGAEIFYNGDKQTIVSGTLTISNFDSSKPLKFIPVHNDGNDVTLKVSAQSVDGIKISDYSEPLSLNIKITPIADMVINDEFKKFDVNGDANASGKYNYVTNEADNDSATNNNKILLNSIYKTPSQIAPYDTTAPAEEVATFVITGLDAKFDVQGASFLGGVGASRQWVATLEDLKAADKVYIKTQKHFAGEISFIVDAVTTETKGDSEKHSPKSAKIFVKPDAADGILESLSVTQQEDAWVKLTFLDKFNNKDGGEPIDGKESLSKVWLKGSDLTNLEISLDKSTIINKTTLNTDTDGYYTQDFSGGVWVRVDPTKTTGTPLPHSDKPYDIGVKYEVKDEVKDGGAVLDTATKTNTATYKVNVEAVTDQPTVALVGTSINEIIDTTDNNTSNDTFTKIINITSPDKDGSEKFTRIEVTGVPEGIGIEGGVYGGDTWYIDINDQSIENTPLSHTLTFKVIGNFSNTTDPALITITAFTQDKGSGGNAETEEESANATFNLTLIGGTGGVTTELIDEFATTNTDIDEDNSDGFALQDVVNASFHSGKSAPFTFVLYDLPEDVEVTGANGVNLIKQGNVWVINGSGNTAAINNVLNNVKIKMPPNYSTNDTTSTGNDGKLPFKVQLTAYGASGKTEKTAKEPVNVTVKPKTDPMDFNGAETAVTTDEDTTVDIVVNFANEKDGTHQKIVDGKVYFQVDESAMSGIGGTLQDSNGTPLVKVTNPNGLPNGTYYALDVGVPLPTSTTVKYTPAEHKVGSVSIKTFVTHKETHNIGDGYDSGKVTSTMTHKVTVNEAPDSLKIKSTNAIVSGNEDDPNGIELPYEVSKIDEDGEDKLASVLVKNIPQNYIIYYDDGTGQKIANNIGIDGHGNNSWSVLAKADGSPSKIYLKAPENESGVVDGIELIAVTTDNLLSDPATIKATIKPIADDVTLNPTATYGKEYAWINLNLNTDMQDSDGSETLTLEISGTTPLDKTALFKVGDSYVEPTSVSFVNGKYTISKIPADKANDIKILYHDYDGTLNIKATTVDSLTDGDTTYTDTLATPVTSTMELKISDSFNIDVSSETKGMTIMTEDLTIPIKATAHNDTIVFNPKEGVNANVSLDFKDIADEIRNVETIDIKIGSVAITNLTIADVKKMTDSNNKLKIDGDNQDSIKLDSGWGDGAVGATYTTYAKNGATLEIDNSIIIS